MILGFFPITISKSRKVQEFLKNVIKFRKTNTVSISFMRSLNNFIPPEREVIHSLSLYHFQGALSFVASDPMTSVLVSHFNRRRHLNGEQAMIIGSANPNKEIISEGLLHSMKETGRFLIEERMRVFFTFDDCYLNQILTMGMLKKKILQISVFPYSEIDILIPDTFATDISVRIEVQMNKFTSFRLRTQNPNVKLYFDFVDESCNLFLNGFNPIKDQDLTIDSYSKVVEFRNPRIFNMKHLCILFPPQIDPEDFFTFLYSKLSIDLTQVTYEKISETFLNLDESSSSSDPPPETKKRSYNEIEKDLDVETFMCRYCKTKPVETIYFPCSHYVSCKSCFFILPTPIDCYYCGKRVKEYVNILSSSRQRIK